MRSEHNVHYRDESFKKCSYYLKYGYRFWGRRACCHAHRFFGGFFSFSTRLASTKKIRLEMEGRVPEKLVFDPDRVNQVRDESPGAYVGGGRAYPESHTKESSDCCPVSEKHGVIDPPLNDSD